MLRLVQVDELGAEVVADLIKVAQPRVDFYLLHNKLFAEQVDVLSVPAAQGYVLHVVRVSESHDDLVVWHHDALRYFCRQEGLARNLIHVGQKLSDVACEKLIE